jgi:hypothetical protein
MEQWQKYDLRFVCDEGIFSQSFTAEGIFQISLPVLEGAFPRDSNVFGVNATATRTNSTTITVQYVDADNATEWVYVEISHRSGTQTITDYIYNDTGSMQTLQWAEATNTTHYDVYVLAYRSDADYVWRLVVSSPLGEANPWAGLLSGLGSWPRGFDADQIPAAIIIVCVLAVFSYFSSTIGIILGVIVAGLFAALGWFVIPPATLVFAAFVGVIAHFAESKKTEREV